MAAVMRSEIKVIFTCPATGEEVTAVDWSKDKKKLAEFSLTSFVGGCCSEHEYAEMEFDIKCTCGDTHSVI